MREKCAEVAACWDAFPSAFPARPAPTDRPHTVCGRATKARFSEVLEEEVSILEAVLVNHVLLDEVLKRPLLDLELPYHFQLEVVDHLAHL
ncbi:MAG: hypothetical protein ACPIOQ_59175, partial [Promethearchaeia archaeon]